MADFGLWPARISPEACDSLEVSPHVRAILASLVALAGTGGILRDQWPDLDLERQQAIIKAVLDHAVIAPGAPGARRLDINRVQPHWRV